MVMFVGSMSVLLDVVDDKRYQSFNHIGERA